MKILGKELTFNGNKVYHAGNKPTASEIGAAASSHTHNYAGSSSAGGNANAAVKLATARTINGTSFDGSANITTANWGTARNITVGNTKKSVNGSADVTWSLSEIGALPLTGGTMTGAINSSLSSGTYLAGNQGKALVNSTATAGAFTTLIKGNSTNGYFTLSSYQQGLFAYYTAKSTVDAGTNSVTKTVKLLDESGNTAFPGTVSASGGFSGNATTASKLQNTRTISLSGDVTGSASFDGGSNVTISSESRRCVVGQTSNTNTNPYYKFASITVPDAHSDREIVFKVSTGYSQNTASGILRAHIRTNTDKVLDNAQFYWEYASTGIDPAKFVMAHSTTTPFTVELWVKIDAAYMHYHFDVLQEHDRGNTRNRWTLYNTCAAGSASAITSGYTQIASTRLDITNSTTGNAKTATTLQTARTINGTSFNGSANITTANWGTARNITIGNTTKSVNGSGNVSWTLSEIGAADASKLLPLTGGKLTGRLTADGKISVPTTGASYLNGKNISNASIGIITKQTSGAYHPIVAVESASSHVVNLGGINDEVGFFGYQAARTENGVDWYFKFNAGNGNINHTGTMQSSKFVCSNGSGAFLEKWYNGGKTARIDYYQNPNRLELFWSATNNGSDWTWANTIYFDENGTVKARTFNVNGARIAYDTSSPNNIQFTRPDGAEYAQITCRHLNIGAYSGVTRKLHIETSAPASPKTGDVWIQV